jgi:hypothetical protein
MYNGSCLCGAVQYEIRGELGAGFFCHCSRCRKAGGSAFAANVLVATTDFVITVGESSLRQFSTAEGSHRLFCERCGSPIYSRREQMPEIVRVRMGSLDTPVGQGPDAHIFVASKAPWFEIRDQLPQHPQRPPLAPAKP